MAAVIPFMMNASTVLSTVGALSSAQSNKATADYEGRQNQYNAVEAEGDANRQAAEIRRQGNVMESDTVAAMVAAGGSASDAGAIEHLSKIHAANEYDALNAVFQGDVRAREHRMRADAAFKEGDNAMRAGYANAVTTAVGGAMKYADWRADHK